MKALTASLLLASTLFACASDDSYDDMWGSEEIVTGKADGLLDGAQILAFDEVGTGYVEKRQMDVFAIDLKGGDKITAVMNVTSGNLDPHFTLYDGPSIHVSSTTFTRATKKITKTYEIDSTGRHYIAVRAYQNQGAGKYSFKITCTGGPCAGQPVVRVLTIEEKAECIGAARTCSFAALPQYAGNVGPARARTVFEGCLDAAQTFADGVACDDACDGTEGTALCNSVISALPFYADQSGACITELEECMDTCFENGNDADADSELWETRLGICWEHGFNGNCDSYARGHAKCGGSYADDSNEECHALCESTDGAWMDDLDLICVEACD